MAGIFRRFWPNNSANFRQDLSFRAYILNFSLALFPNRAKINELAQGMKMLAGMVASAVTGGLVGLGYALTQDHGVVQTILSYQLGGFIALLTFLASSSARAAESVRLR